jgi:hypothetical protein
MGLKNIQKYGCVYILKNCLKYSILTSIEILRRVVVTCDSKWSVTDMRIADSNTVRNAFKILSKI